MINIKVPIWHSRSVGIAKHRVVPGNNEVNILYKDCTGERVYPNTFNIDSTKIRKYPIQMVKGITLYIVPIDDMEVK